MADLMPDYVVEQQRLIRRVRDQESRMEACKLQYMEAQSQQRSALRNIASHKEELERLAVNLKELEKEHGAPKIDWDALIEAVNDEEEEGGDG